MKLFFVNTKFLFINVIFDFIGLLDSMYIFCIFKQLDNGKQSSLPLVDDHIVHAMRIPNNMFKAEYYDGYKYLDPGSQLICRLLNSCESTSSHHRKPKEALMFHMYEPNERLSYLIYNVPIHSIPTSDYASNIINLAMYKPISLYTDMHNPGFRTWPQFEIEMLEDIYHTNSLQTDEGIFVIPIIKMYKSEEKSKNILSLVLIMMELMNIQQRTLNFFCEIVSDVFINGKQNVLYCSCFNVVIQPNQNLKVDDIIYLLPFVHTTNAILPKILNREYLEMEFNPIQTLVDERLGIIVSDNLLDCIDNLIRLKNMYDIYLQSLSTPLYYSYGKNLQAVVNQNMASSLPQCCFLITEPIKFSLSNQREFDTSIFEPIKIKSYSYLDNLESSIYLGNTISGLNSQEPKDYEKLYHENTCEILAMHLDHFYSNILYDLSNFLYLEYLIYLLNFNECMTKDEPLENRSLQNHFQIQGQPYRPNKDHASNKFQKISNGFGVLGDVSNTESFTSLTEEHEFPETFKENFVSIPSETLSLNTPSIILTYSNLPKSSKLYSEDEFFEDVSPQNQELSYDELILADSLRPYPITSSVSQDNEGIPIRKSNLEPSSSENNLNVSYSNLYFVSEITNPNFNEPNILNINVMSTPVISTGWNAESEFSEDLYLYNNQASIPNNIFATLVEMYPDVTHFQYLSNLDLKESIKPNVTMSQHNQDILLDSGFNEEPSAFENNINFNNSYFRLISDVMNLSSSFITNPNTESNISESSESMMYVKPDPKRESFDEGFPHYTHSTKLVGSHPDLNDMYFQHSTSHMKAEISLHPKLITTINFQYNQDILKKESDPRLSEGTSSTKSNLTNSFLHSVSGITNFNSSFIIPIAKSSNSFPTDRIPLPSNLNNAEFVKTYSDNEIVFNYQLEENLTDSVKPNHIYLPPNTNKEFDLQNNENPEINSWQHLVGSEGTLVTHYDDKNPNSYVMKTPASDQFNISDSLVFENYPHNSTNLLTSVNSTNIPKLTFPLVNPFILTNFTEADELSGLRKSNISYLADLHNDKNFNESYRRYFLHEMNLTDVENSPLVNIWNNNIPTLSQNHTQHYDEYLLYLLNLMNKANTSKTSNYTNFLGFRKHPDYLNKYQNDSQWEYSNSTVLQYHPNLNTTYLQYPYPKMFYDDKHEQVTQPDSLQWNTTDPNLLYPKLNGRYLQYLLRLMNSGNSSINLQYLLRLINSIDDSETLDSYGYSNLFELEGNQWNMLDGKFSKASNMIYLQYLQNLMNSTEGLEKAELNPEFSLTHPLFDTFDLESQKYLANNTRLQYLLSLMNSTNTIPFSSGINNAEDKILRQSQALNNSDVINITQNPAYLQYLLSKLNSTGKSATSNLDSRTWSPDVEPGINLEFMQSPDEITRQLLQLSPNLNDQTFLHQPQNITNIQNLLRILKGSIPGNSSLPLSHNTSSLGNSHSPTQFDSFKPKTPSFNPKKKRPKPAVSNRSPVNSQRG